jgi:hypothetical protein
MGDLNSRIVPAIQVHCNQYFRHPNTASKCSTSEPDVGDHASVSWQVFEAVEAFEALERNVAHVFRRGQAQVDGDSGPAVLPWRQAAPAHEVAANTAEVEGDRPGIPDIAGEHMPRVLHMDALVIVAIGPEHPGTAAYRAIAYGGVGNFTLKPPLHRAAMAVPLRNPQASARLLHCQLRGLSNCNSSGGACDDAGGGDDGDGGDSNSADSSHSHHRNSNCDSGGSHKRDSRSHNRGNHSRSRGRNPSRCRC